MKEYLEKLKEQDDFKISPHVVMRRFKVNFEMGQKICNAFWMKRNIEMRRFVRGMR